MMKVFWHAAENFGDKLTPYVLDRLNIHFEYTEQGSQEEHYILCGSILSACNEHSIIWGAGLAESHEIIRPKEIRAVRGIKTRNYLLSKGIDCPAIYGDFGQILPYVFNPTVNKKRKVGVIPHVIDQHLFPDGWNLNKGVEETINYILESEFIISSSLHVLIAAQAYGVEWQWIRSKNVIGQDFKFYDFFQTEYDIKRFIETCPFKQTLLEFATRNGYVTAL